MSRRRKNCKKRSSAPHEQAERGAPVEPKDAHGASAPAHTCEQAGLEHPWLRAVRSSEWILPALLAVLSLALYARSIGYPFVYWDDNSYVDSDPRIARITLANVWRILADGFIGNYHPITTFTFAFDRALWGTWLPGFHLTQLAFHALGVVLVYYLCRAVLREPLAAFAAAGMFAAHTAHVESVVWLASRKDVVCLVFYAGALLAYVAYSSDRPNRARMYALALALAAAAMLSKAYAVVLPAVMLAYDVCFAKRLGRRQLVDKIPFVLLSVGGTLLTVVMARTGGAFRTPGVLLTERLSMLCKVFAAYVGKTLLPLGLSAYYDLGPGWLNAGVALLGVVLGAGAVAGFVFLRRREPPAAFGIAMFVIPLSTVMNTFFILPQWMADRFLLFPTIGSSLALAAGGAWAYRRLAPSRARPAVPAAAAATVVIYAALTLMRTGVWSSGVALWSDVVRKNLGLPGSGPLSALELRGTRAGDIADGRVVQALSLAYRFAGDVKESGAILDLVQGSGVTRIAATEFLLAERDVAQGEYEKAVERLMPLTQSGAGSASADAWTHIASAYKKMQRPDDARAAYRKAVEAYRKSGGSSLVPLLELGTIEFESRRYDESVRWFREATDEAHPRDPRPGFNLALSSERLGKFEDAYALCSGVLELEGRALSTAKFDFSEVHTEMSIIAEKLGRLQAAAEHIEKGIASTPAAGDRAERHIKAAVLSEKLQRPQQALVHYLEVLRLAPNHKQATDIRLKAAQILEEKLDRPQEALAQFEEALRLAPGHPQAVDIRLKIGLLREALGRREDALRSFEEAIRADGEHPQAAAIRARIRSLREGPPSAEPGPAGRAVE